MSPILAFSIAVIFPTPCFGYTTKSFKLYTLFSVGCFLIFLISGFSSCPGEEGFFSISFRETFVFLFLIFLILTSFLFFLTLFS